MDLTAIMFYLFAALMIFSALMVVTVKNPVHAVLFLILAFINAAGLFLLTGAEFLAMILVIVYVGAVAVLFLFVVMMLDISFAELKKGFLKNILIGGPIAAILLAELIVVFMKWSQIKTANPVMTIPESGLTNTQALGQVVYTDYALLFQASGVILLVAMIGAIVLTLRHRQGVLRQNVSQQLARRPKDVIKLVKVKSGEGA